MKVQWNKCDIIHWMYCDHALQNCEFHRKIVCNEVKSFCSCTGKHWTQFIVFCLKFKMKFWASAVWLVGLPNSNESHRNENREQRTSPPTYWIRIIRFETGLQGGIEMVIVLCFETHHFWFQFPRFCSPTCQTDLNWQ